MHKINTRTKKSRKLMELKRLLLNSDGISRSEAATLTDLDIRTAGAYLEELVESGLARGVVQPPKGQGRPSVLFLPNRDNLCYVGLLISAELVVTGCIIDYDDNILSRDSFRFDKNCSKLTVFRRLLDFIKESVVKHPEYRLTAAGIAISRWLQPPLASYDLYSGLADYLTRESGVPVYRDININMLAYLYSKRYNCRNLALVSPGRVIELGMVINNFPVAKLYEHEQWLAHLTMNPQGRKCYCGKRGCLENYVTAGALQERWNASGGEGDFSQAVTSDDPAALKQVHNTEIILGRACREISETYHPDLICLPHRYKNSFDTIMKGYGNATSELKIVDGESLTVDIGAAQLAAFLSTHQFMKTQI